MSLALYPSRVRSNDLLGRFLKAKCATYSENVRISRVSAKVSVSSLDTSDSIAMRSSIQSGSPKPRGAVFNQESTVPIDVSGRSSLTLGPIEVASQDAADSAISCSAREK